MDLWTTEKSSTHLTFDVSSGVDEDIISLNLSALANVHKVYFLRDNADRVVSFTPYFITATILAWFASMGIDALTVRTWLELCIREHFKKNVHDSNSENGAKFPDLAHNLDIFFKCFSYMETTCITHRESTLYPLPSFIDVR